MFTKLPVDLKFSFKPGATIYMPGRVTSTIVRGYGHITLSFGSTRQPSVLSVGIRDLHWRLLPFAIPLDVDQDGQFESIELRNVELDIGFLDREASQGTLDLRTGDFDLSFEYMVTSKQVPVLAKWGGQSMKFTVRDRGKMDLQTGSFEIHSGIIEIKDGPLAGARIRGGGLGELDRHSSFVNLRVAIPTPLAYDCGDTKHDRVIICPGDQVFLCWHAGPAFEGAWVELDPGSVRYETMDGNIMVTPGGPPDAVYRVTTHGPFYEAEDTVEVHFYQAGEPLGPYGAKPVNNGLGAHWNLKIDSTEVSERIEVRGIRIQTLQGCIGWTHFWFAHYPPGGDDADADSGLVEIDALENLDVDPTFSAAGTWRFWPRVTEEDIEEPPHPDERGTPPVCFVFWGSCRPG